MNIQSIISFLQDAKNVSNWNFLISYLTEIGMTPQQRNHIETSGLIVKVLGSDKTEK